MKYQLNPEQEAWVCALESGLYKQGMGNLRQLLDDRLPESIAAFDSQFCCLGVACELFVQRQNRDDLRQRRVNTRVFSYDHQSGELPPTIMRHFGFRDAAGGVEDRGTDYGEFDYSTLAAANDDGVSFATIAQFVRRYPEQIFNVDSLIQIPD